MENKKKYNCDLTAKQYQLIQWFNKSFKFGKCEIIIHASDPTDFIIKEITGKFDGIVKDPLTAFDEKSKLE